MQGEECNSERALERSARAAQAAAAAPPPHLQRDSDGATGAAAARALGVGLRELVQEHMQEYLPYGTAYLEVEKLRQKMKLLM